MTGKGECRFDFKSKYTDTNFITGRLLDGYFDAVARLLSGLDMKSALEIGCGEGFSTERLRAILPAGASFEASDVEQRLVQAAQKRNPDVPVTRESIYAPDRSDASVDAVFVLEVLEHLDDPESALCQACRVARKWVIASVPREPVWRLMNMARLKYLRHLGNTPGHLQHWSASGFRKFIGRSADVIGCETPLPWTIVLAKVQSGRSGLYKNAEPL